MVSEDSKKFLDSHTEEVLILVLVEDGLGALFILLISSFY